MPGRHPKKEEANMPDKTIEYMMVIVEESEMNLPEDDQSTLLQSFWITEYPEMDNEQHDLLAVQEAKKLIAVFDPPSVIRGLWRGVPM